MGTPGALGVGQVDLLDEFFDLEVGLHDSFSGGHFAGSHGLINDLDLVHDSHAGCSQDSVLLLADVEGDELPLFDVSYDVDVVPASAVPGEGDGVVEGSCPEEGDVVHWHFSAHYIQGGH